MLYFHQLDFYLGGILFINSASICTVFLSIVLLLLNKDSFITPTCIYAVLFSSLQLLFIQYSFNLSSFYLYSILFTNTAYASTAFFSFIQLLFIQSYFHQ